VALRRERFIEAREHYEKALEIRRARAARYPDDPGARANLAYAIGRMGQAALGAGDPDAALRFHREALALHALLVDADVSDTRTRRHLINTYEQIGIAQAAAGHHAEAVASYAAMRDHSETLTTQDPANVEARMYLATAHAGLGKALAVLGRQRGARDSFSAAVRVYDAILLINPSYPGAEKGRDEARAWLEARSPARR
jgi:tetratricopeptide (TPR) repeat protein